jgi:hypothetical protein
MGSPDTRSFGIRFAPSGAAAAATRERRADRATGSPSPLGRRPVAGLTRQRLAILAGAVVVVWIVVVFARAVADRASTVARAEAVGRDAAAAVSRLVAERFELLLIQTPAYVRLQARAFGYGPPGERAFALEEGGPPPASITPLGADEAGSGPRSPLEAWLQLLFGP